MPHYELTIISRFHGEEEQNSVIPVARALVGTNATELFYEFCGDRVELKFDKHEFLMRRTGRVDFCLAVSQSGNGYLRLGEGGATGETPLATDFYELRDENNLEFEYHYANMGDDASQRENIKLILKKSEEK